MKKVLFVSLMALCSVGYTFAADTELTAHFSDTGLSPEEIERRRWQEAEWIAEYNIRYEEAVTQAEALRVGERHQDKFEACSALLYGPEGGGVDDPLQREYEAACRDDSARRADEKRGSRRSESGASRQGLW